MQVRQMLFAAAILTGCVSAGWAVAEEKAASQPVKPIPVIFDTDLGDDIDDAWALVMLLKSPQFDVKLITTTDGNAEYRAKLIAKLLVAAKRTDIPIGLGVGKRRSSFSQLDWVKDDNLANYPGKIHKDGVGAIIDTIEKSSEPITVIAIGPLDTMAAVLERQPNVAGKANFVGMYGSVYAGYDNHAKISAEWNVVANPPAAQKIFSAPWRHMTITPLDTCGLVKLSGARFQALKASRDPAVRALLDVYRVFAKKKERR